MALLPKEAKNEDIQTAIESDLFKKYHCHIKEILNIQDSKHKIFIKDLAREKDGFVKEKTNASVVSNNQYKDYDIEFYCDSIRMDTKRIFSKIYDDKVFTEAVLILLKFTLIHELTHVKQIMSGIDMNSEIEVNYSERAIEIEANKTALEVLINESEFAAMIADTIFHKRFVNVDSVPELRKILEGAN